MKILLTITFILILSLIAFGQTESNSTMDFPTLKKLSVEELNIKTQAHDKLWGLSKVKRWDMNQDDGNLIFTLADGMKAIAPAQIIGTYNADDNTWLWSWANSSIDEALTKTSVKLREYGNKNQIEQLSKSKWKGTEEDAWAMAAIGVKLGGLQGAYRGPAGTNLYVFIAFGEVKLSKQ